MIVLSVLRRAPRLASQRCPWSHAPTHKRSAATSSGPSSTIGSTLCNHHAGLLCSFPGVERAGSRPAMEPCRPRAPVLLKRAGGSASAGSGGGGAPPDKRRCLGTGAAGAPASSDVVSSGRGGSGAGRVSGLPQVAGAAAAPRRAAQTAAAPPRAAAAATARPPTAGSAWAPRPLAAADSTERGADGSVAMA